MRLPTLGDARLNAMTPSAYPMVWGLGILLDTTSIRGSGGHFQSDGKRDYLYPPPESRQVQIAVVNLEGRASGMVVEPLLDATSSGHPKVATDLRRLNTSKEGAGSSPPRQKRAKSSRRTVPPF